MMGTNLSATGQLILASQPAPWSKYAGNPDLSPSQTWDAGLVMEPDVMFDGGTYKMWYGGCAQVCQIGYATSPDGIAWTPYSGNPVVAANASSWDTTLGMPRVVRDGTVYRMWYEGNGPSGIRVGYATSLDGIQWAKYGSWPIFNGTQTWDAGSVNTAAIVKTGTTFVMYFSGHSATSYDLSVGRATSPDGINWTESAANPVLAPQEAWEGTRIYVSWITYGTSGYYDLYYYGGSVGSIVYIGHATSADGLTWTRDAANPILSPGPPGSWDGSTVAHPCLITVGTQVRMYFTGYKQSFWQIGFATWSASGVAYATSGSWISAVFDSGDPNTTWSSLSWIATEPSNTTLGVSLQVGNTSTPDLSWSLSPPEVTSPVALHLPKTRYARVIVALVSLDASRTPILSSVSVTYEKPGSGAVDFWGLGLVGFVALLAFVVGAAAVFALIVLVPTKRDAHTVPQVPGALGVFCLQCGAAVPSGQPYCGRCGFPVTPPREPGHPGA